MFRHQMKAKGVYYKNLDEFYDEEKAQFTDY